jgi:hypothetical protein
MATVQAQPQHSRRVVETEVDAEGYRGLLMSRRRLVRVDRHGDGLRRLYDLDSGELFFIDERRLVDVEG